MIIFPEDDLEVIQTLLGTKNGENAPQRPPVCLHYISGFSEHDPFFKNLYWKIALKPV